MGEVYLAHSPAGDPVAVKVIRGDRLDPVARARFEKEALIARTVVGTNRVARFLDADPYADRPWMAMEYVPGETLLGHVDAQGPLPAPLVASLGALLAEGLAAVHAAELLHRDLKPQNVIMGEYGPMVIDFGLGAFLDGTRESLSHSGMIIGTVRCMSPEQAVGNPRVTTAADVYGLGAVLLYAAAGHYPHDGGRWEVVLSQVADAACAPDLRGLPDALLPLLSAMLAHESGDRPSLTEVTKDCASLLSDVGLSPMDARNALINRTAGGSIATGLLTSPVSLEDLPVTNSAPYGVADEPDSPLDGLRPAEPEALNEADAPDRNTTNNPGRRSRASLRVSEELRSQYATQPTL